MGKTLITGAAGFIGSNLMVKLSRENIEVLGVDNLSRLGVACNVRRLPQAVLEGDVTDPTFFRKLPQDIDVVFHLAATADKPVNVVDARTDFDTNASGTLNVLEFCRGVGAAIVYASSSKVYSERLNEDLCLVRRGQRVMPSDGCPATIGADSGPDLTSVPPICSRSPYGCSKLVGEIYCHEYLAAYGVPFVINRMGCVYGPHQLGNERQGWFTWLVTAKILGRPFTVYGDGYQVRDLLYVEDLNELLLCQARNISSTSGRTYVIGGGMDNSVSVLEAIRLVDSLLPGRKLDTVHAPPRLSDHMYFVADTTRVRADLSWSPRTDIRQGLRNVVTWLEDEQESLGAWV